MLDIHDIEHSAFIGISCSTKVIYNVVERDGEFEYTGLSLIQFLKTDKNKFISEFFKSQSYDGIKLLLDDELKFGDLNDSQNVNIDTLKGVNKLISESDVFKHFYIYNVIDDVIMIKTPQLKKMIALDYKNSNDVRNFINNIKTGDYNG